MKKQLSNMTTEEKDVLLQRFLSAPEEQLFPQEAIALYLQCSTNTLQRMRCIGGGIPYAKIGRTVAYKKKDVLHYQESRTVMNTAQLAS
ncbi:helix-turn-helix domain-containing protein [Acinetobacter brisouii]